MDDIQKKADFLIQWLREKGREAGCDGAVVGISGGVDSALCLALLTRAWPEKTLGLILPCHSQKEDVEDAILVAQHFSCEYKIVDLSRTYDTLVNTISVLPSDERSLAFANLKPRLRMLTLYYFANLYNYIVVGTGNKDELYIGYFTKYGDGGVDLLPLGDLTKSEVRQMALYMGVPEKIVYRVPSAGLWEGQTDEEEMGISYNDLDAYLTGREVSPEVAERIERLHRKSEHKRKTPPVAYLK